MRLSDEDAAFLYAETASGPMHGASIAILEGVIDFDTVYAHIDARLHLVPRYRQRLAFVPFNVAHPKWVDDPDFDLRNHVKHHRLNAGCQLEDAIEAALVLAEPLLPRSRPLWLTYVIEGLEDRTILLQLGHHAMVDGASGVDISLLLFDLQKHAAAPEPPKSAWSPAPLPSAAKLAAEAAAETLQNLTDSNPFRSQNFSTDRFELLRRATESITRFVAEPVITAPWNVGAVGPKRELAWRKFSFSQFRDIRKKFGGTINDVVLAVVVEAAARYMQDHGVTTKGRHVRVMCPVNVRSEDETGALGNRVSGIFPVFDAEPQAITERLRKVRWETEQIKQNREAQAASLLRELAPSIPAALMAPTLLVGTPLDPTALAARFPPPLPSNLVGRAPLLGFNFTCTNVPGVQTPQYVAGHQVLDTLVLLMLGGNLGYGVAVMSYNQNLYFNFVCDPRLMPDVELMASSVEEAFHELLEASQEESRAVGGN
ncbi:MAG: wax ester/triacylglycerol synthase domain-containing protein [Pseudomonadales bacterium]